MKRTITILSILIISIAVFSHEIHCKHFLYGMPQGSPDTNDIIIRDCYALSSDDNTKFADWVCYRLTKAEITGSVSQTRTWKADPWLDETETLEPNDYKDANSDIGTDRGHQAPLASFKGTNCWSDTNYLSNITPQKSDLNQGAWKKLEDAVRHCISSSSDHNFTLWVITGPIYGDTTMKLPKADEFHKVPKAYWKIVATKSGTGIQVNAFIMPQDTPRAAHFQDYQTTVDEIEHDTGLDFFWALDDTLETPTEATKATLFLQ